MNLTPATQANTQMMAVIYPILMIGRIVGFIEWIVFYAVSAIFQPYEDGKTCHSQALEY